MLRDRPENASTLHLAQEAWLSILITLDELKPWLSETRSDNVKARSCVPCDPVTNAHQTSVMIDSEGAMWTGVSKNCQGFIITQQINYNSNQFKWQRPVVVVRFKKRLHMFPIEALSIVILMGGWFANWEHQRRFAPPEFFSPKWNNNLSFCTGCTTPAAQPALRGFPLSPWLTKLLPNIWAWCQSLWRLSNFTSSPSSKHCSLEAPATRKARLNHPAVNGGVGGQSASWRANRFSPKTATWTRAKSNTYTSTPYQGYSMKMLTALHH